MLVCLFPIGNGVQYQIVLRSAVAKCQPRKKVHESLIHVDCCTSIPDKRNGFRRNAAFEELVAYLVATTLIGEADGKVALQQRYEISSDFSLVFLNYWILFICFLLPSTLFHGFFVLLHKNRNTLCHARPTE